MGRGRAEMGARRRWPGGRWTILGAAALILALALGVRQSFGLFLAPLSADLGLGREVFSLTLAFQNLVWGLAQPVAGAVADRLGPARVIAVGGLFYALGLVVMAGAGGPAGLHIGAGLLVGLGLSATSFSVVLGAVGRYASPARRSLALGLVSAAGSFGQFVVVIPAQAAISGLGWVGAALGLAVLAGVMVPLAAALARRRKGAHEGAHEDAHEGVRKAGRLPDSGEPLTRGEPLAQALAGAGRHGGFWLLSAGFFICGFQVVLIGVHLPAYLADRGLGPEVAAIALAMIGLANMAGTVAAGWLGGRWRKKHLLALLYLARSGVIALLIALPMTATTAVAISAALGLLWLGTIPLTSGLVAQIFGPAHLGTLFGLVFLGHQMGGFLGAWTGGLLYDLTGGYDAAWMAAVGLGLLAAALHWPIRDAPVAAVARDGAPAA